MNNINIKNIPLGKTSNFINYIHKCANETVASPFTIRKAIKEYGAEKFAVLFNYPFRDLEGFLRNPLSMYEFHNLLWHLRIHSKNNQRAS